MTKRQLLRLAHENLIEQRDQRKLVQWFVETRGITEAQAAVVVKLARPDQRKVWRQEAQQQ